MPRPVRTAASAAVAAAALALTLLPATAGALPTPDDAVPGPGSNATELPAGMLAALERDLGITADQAAARLDRESQAIALATELSERLSGYAGSWLDGEGAALVVATSEPAEAAEITAAGATAEVVEHSLARLEAVQARLDGADADGLGDGAVWYVDTQANEVVLHASSSDGAAALIDAAGADPAAVTVRLSAEQPELYYDLVGGDPYFPGGSRCTVGFSAYQGDRPGFVSAGHCGTVGTSTTGFNGAIQGVFAGSVFPGSDMAWIEVNDNWTPTPYVRGPGGSLIEVHGSTQAPVGSSICRAGTTTGWHCGTIQQHNASISYPQGTVTGLSRASLCSEPGDSGGPVMAGNQAQGIISGGSGNCTTGGTLYYQPINPILNQWGLTLVTIGG